MAPRVILDHIGHFVSDMDEASTALDALGFTATPFSIQENTDAAGRRVRAGTANRCIMLEEGYLEVLTAVSETPLAAQLNAALDRYAGMHLVAFATDDPEAVHARLEAEGFAPHPPVNLRRETTTEAGGSAEVGFTVLRVPPEAMPEGRIQYLEHLTPDLVWQRRWLGHVNGVKGLEGAFIVVADPAEALARYARFLGFRWTPLSGGGIFDLDRGFLAILGREGLARILPGVEPPTLPWMAGYALAVADPAASFRFLEAREQKLVRSAWDLFTVAAPPPLAAVLLMGGKDAARRHLAGFEG